MILPYLQKGFLFLFFYFSMSYLLTKYYFSTSKLLIISKAIFKCTLKNVNQKRVSILIIIFANAMWDSMKRSFAKCDKNGNKGGTMTPKKAHKNHRLCKNIGVGTNREQRTFKS